MLCYSCQPARPFLFCFFDLTMRTRKKNGAFVFCYLNVEVAVGLLFCRFWIYWPNAVRWCWFCCCHKASAASEWWRDPWLMTWPPCGSPPPAPVGEEAGDGLPHILTDPAPSTSQPSTSPILLVPGDLAPPSSSFHLSMDRRRAFMKKLPTVVGSNPNCLAIVTCISFDGRFVS